MVGGEILNPLITMGYNSIKYELDEVSLGFGYFPFRDLTDSLFLINLLFIYNKK